MTQLASPVLGAAMPFFRAAEDGGSCAQDVGNGALDLLVGHTDESGGAAVLGMNRWGSFERKPTG